MLLKNKKIGWNFPVNDDGQESGFNDPGIETFKDNPLSNVAREVLQNSLDARDEASSKPVEVHFQKLELPTSEFPGVKDLKKSLLVCATDWKSFKRTARFVKDALDLLSGPLFTVLKISDYNTTGIIVGAKADRASDWHKITKAVGVSDKNAGKLGSFGIGKHAPYVCSDLRTVFYVTKDMNGATAVQGVAKLPSYAVKGQVTQGTGYYGIKAGNRPIFDFGDAPSMLERKRVGADLYVMGFHDYPDWEARIVKSVIESFFVAIHKGRLIVKVGKTTLNSLSLPDMIRKHYAEPDPKYFADEYYEVLIREDATVHSEENLCGWGAIKLRVLENKDFRKKVAMFRHSGMKIYDKGHFQTPLRFAGVFTVESPKLDSLLRTLEPPSHNAWEPERGEDPVQAKRVLNELKKWINDKVRQLAAADEVTEVDAEGISQYLPDELEDDSKGAQQELESLRSEPAGKLDMRIRLESPSAPAPKPDGGDSDEGGGEEGGPDGPGPTGEGGSGGSGEGGEGQEGEGAGGDRGDHGKRVPLNSVRVWCSDPNAGKYRLLFEPQSAAQQLRIFVIGEVGAEPAPIVSYSINNGPEIGHNGKGFIGPLSLTEGKRAVLDVVLRDSLRCALGVTAHAG